MASPEQQRPESDGERRLHRGGPPPTEEALPGDRRLERRVWTRPRRRGHGRVWGRLSLQVRADEQDQVEAVAPVRGMEVREGRHWYR